jgi:peptidoglycan glycosyltransferase
MKVVLTLDAALQEKAFSLLKGKKGVILAIDPRTGEILTYASSPSVSLEEVKEKSGEAFKDQPLIDRISQGLYPPGSVFKIVTLAAALEAGLPLSQTFKAPASLRVEGGKVTNYQRKDYGTLSLGKAFEKSVNTVFAQVGLKLGKEKLKKEAEKFGFNQVFKFDLPVKKSSFPWPETQLDLAWQAIGQGKVLVTPLQVGILGLVLANQGSLKMPFLVKEIKTSGGKPFRVNQPETISLLEPEVAWKLKEAMVKAVNYGTGRQAKLPGVKVAGKTGTAELDGGQPHSWFVCFAPAEKPEIVLVTLVEHGGLGGRKAAFLSREFLRFFFNQRGQVLVE